ncbi:MAG TPA: hypothetical protein VI522_04115 [Gammaproteobacteria bacterium]|nr:hypothetical protein [Gammaproteobacteria bacterium]
MAQVIIRNLDSADIEVLKLRSAHNRHSLEQELRLMIHQEAQRSRGDFLAKITTFRANLTNRPQSSSTELLREDRDR